MPKPKVVTTSADITRAIAQAQSLTGEPRVLSVEYRAPGWTF